jgi:hypothetical protein
MVNNFIEPTQTRLKKSQEGAKVSDQYKQPEQGAN